jgi:FKBP-type peptidyl-prolyl cis-trans isomerase (trigger factor)
MSTELAPSAQTFVTVISKKDLHGMFVKYWDIVKNNIDPTLIKKATKGGYRDARKRVAKMAGGNTVFYRPLLVDLVNSEAEKQGKGILYFDTFDLASKSENEYEIKASVSLIPEITWASPIPGIDEELVIEMPDITQEYVDSLVAKELEHSRDKSALLVPVEEGATLADGHVVVLSAESVADGKPYEPGCFANNKWLMDRKLFKLEGAYELLLGAKVGESKKLTTKAPDQPELEVEVTLKIQQIFNRNRPPLDDDLAITFGFKTLDAYKTDILQKLKKVMDEEAKKLAIRQIMIKLGSKVSVSPVSTQWMLSKGTELFMDRVKTFKSEDVVLDALTKQLGLKEKMTRDAAINHAGQLAAQNLVEDLVIKSWGEKKGLVKEFVKLDNLPDYVRIVLKHLIDNSKTIKTPVEIPPEMKP